MTLFNLGPQINVFAPNSNRFDSLAFKALVVIPTGQPFIKGKTGNGHGAGIDSLVGHAFLCMEDTPLLIVEENVVNFVEASVEDGLPCGDSLLLAKTVEKLAAIFGRIPSDKLVTIFSCFRSSRLVENVAILNSLLAGNLSVNLERIGRESGLARLLVHYVDGKMVHVKRLNS